MRFYTQQHLYYCGVDLHARSLYVCILDHGGNVLVHRNLSASPEAFLQVIAPYRQDIAVAAECMFAWYWLADLCEQGGMPFVHPRRLSQARQDRRPPPQRHDPHRLRLSRSHARHPRSPAAPDAPHAQAGRTPRPHPEHHQPGQPPGLREEPRLRVQSRGRPRALRQPLRAQEHRVILYEIHDIRRFPTVQDFASYARLVKCAHESAGKRTGTSGKKIGNAHLKWAFSEAAVLSLRQNPNAQAWLKKAAAKHGKPKALSILAHKLGRTVYYLLLRDEAFDMNRFLAA